MSVTQIVIIVTIVVLIFGVLLPWGILKIVKKRIHQHLLPVEMGTYEPIESASVNIFVQDKNQDKKFYLSLVHCVNQYNQSYSDVQLIDSQDIDHRGNLTTQWIIDDLNRLRTLDGRFIFIGRTGRVSVVAVPNNHLGTSDLLVGVSTDRQQLLYMEGGTNPAQVNVISEPVLVVFGVSTQSTGQRLLFVHPQITWQQMNQELFCKPFKHPWSISVTPAITSKNGAFHFGYSQLNGMEPPERKFLVMEIDQTLPKLVSLQEVLTIPPERSLWSLAPFNEDLVITHAAAAAAVDGSNMSSSSLTNHHHVLQANLLNTTFYVTLQPAPNQNYARCTTQKKDPYRMVWNGITLGDTEDKFPVVVNDEGLLFWKLNNTLPAHLNLVHNVRWSWFI